MVTFGFSLPLAQGNKVELDCIVYLKAAPTGKERRWGFDCSYRKEVKSF